MQIKHRYNGIVLFEVAAESIKVDLRGSNLRGAKNAHIIMLGLAYPIYIESENIRIGCELHTPNEWENFTDEEIKAMGPGVTEFWAAHKDMVLGIAKHHAESAEKLKEEAA